MSDVKAKTSIVQQSSATTIPKDTLEEAKRLREEIERHDNLYYVKDRSEILDYEFDALLKELIQLESQYPDLITPDSPTQRIGGVVAEGFNPVSHLIPMMSIDSISTDGEAYNFDKRVKRLLDIEEDVQYVAEPKFDGVSASLTYERGLLTKGATRGDGSVGEDIITNLKTIKTIPLRLKSIQSSDRGSSYGIPNLIEIRGEVLYPLENFKTLNKELSDSGEPLFANPRNAASGAVRHLDSRVTAKRLLDFYAWGIGEIRGLKVTSESQIVDALRVWGFKIDNNVRECSNINEAIKYQREIESARDSLPYEADGIVVKVNRRDYQTRLGATAKHTRWSIAYKFKPRQATTKIKDIVVQVGRTGLLTPVAELEPVKIGGITIKRASLHTEDIIKERDIRFYDTVLIQRAGDVIPEVVMPIKEKRRGEERTFSMPEACPSCATTVEKEGAYYYCPNLSCPSQLKGRIQHLASKKAFNIEGLGERTVEQLLKNKLIKGMGDVFSLKKEDLLPLERFAEKSAENLEREVERSKVVSFDRFINALSIRHVGERVAQVLAENFTDVNSLMETSEEFLIRTPTIGPEIAKSILHFFKSKQNQDLINKMLSTGIHIKYKEKTQIDNNELNGQSFVFTGGLETFTRDEAQEIVESKGGRASSSVTKQTSYVVVGKDPGSKYDKGLSLGIRILEESEFRKLVGID